jgi:hypothetical protein
MPHTHTHIRRTEPKRRSTSSFPLVPCLHCKHILRWKEGVRVIIISPGCGSASPRPQEVADMAAGHCEEGDDPVHKASKRAAYRTTGRMWLPFLLQSSPQDDDAGATCTYTWPTLAHHQIIILTITSSRTRDELRIPTTAPGGGY